MDILITGLKILTTALGGQSQGEHKGAPLAHIGPTRLENIPSSNIPIRTTQ